MLQKPSTALTCSPSDLRCERRQRVIGAEDVARAVDQEDVVALLRRAGLDGKFDIFGAVSALFGFGWHAFDLTLERRFRHRPGRAMHLSSTRAPSPGEVSRVP